MHSWREHKPKTKLSVLGNRTKVFVIGEKIPPAAKREKFGERAGKRIGHIEDECLDWLRWGDMDAGCHGCQIYYKKGGEIVIEVWKTKKRGLSLRFCDPDWIQTNDLLLSLPTTGFPASWRNLWSGLYLHRHRCVTCSLYGTSFKFPRCCHMLSHEGFTDIVTSTYKVRFPYKAPDWRQLLYSLSYRAWNFRGQR